MATERRRFKIGETAPMTGKYRGTDGRVAELQQGETFPPIPGGGEWEYIGEG